MRGKPSAKGELRRPFERMPARAKAGPAFASPALSDRLSSLSRLRLERARQLVFTMRIASAMTWPPVPVVEIKTETGEFAVAA